MTARRLGILTAVAVLGLLVLGTGVVFGADETGHTAQFETETPLAGETSNHTVVDFNWSASCPDQGAAELEEYFDGDIGSSDDSFHVDDAGGADDDPPNGGCVLRSEGENASIVSTPGDQSQELNYYPQRGDSLSWNHYVHNINPVFGEYPGEFEFRFGVQDADDYYFVRLDADNSPLQFVLGEADNGTLATQDSVEVENELTEGTFQPVEIDWRENETIEAVFNGTETVSIDSDSLDAGGITFSREGVSGLVRSYAHMVDEVSAETPSHLQLDGIDHSNVVAPGGELSVNYTLTNTGKQPIVEDEVGLFVSGGKQDADTNVTVGPGTTADGTLTYNFTDEYDEGDSVNFSVQLADWDGQQSGSVPVAEPAELVVDLTTAPPQEVNIEDPLELEYVVENVGDTTASSFVQLSVDAESGYTDFEEVTLAPDETKEGTLIYDDIGSTYSAGENISWEVGVAEHPNTVTGTTLVREPPEFELAEVTAPDDISVGAVMSVEYEIANTGGESGTLSAVDLRVGPDNTVVDTDTDIQVAPGASVSGALEFDGVGGEYEPGDTVDWSVVTASGASTSGQTEVTDGAVLSVTSMDAPDQMGINQDLVVEYTIENSGPVRGVEEYVKLLIDGSLADYDTDVEVLPNGTATGTLVYDSVSAAFGPGDTIPFGVSLEKYGHSLSGQTNISDVDGPGELYFTINPPSPKAGEELLFEAGHYDNSMYYYWLVDGEQVGTGTAATHIFEEPGEYNVTLIESEIPEFPFDDGASAQFNNTVTKTLSVSEGDLIISDLEVSGLHTPLFKELETQRPLKVNIETTEGQEIENVEYEIGNQTRSLYSGGSDGGTQTWQGSLIVDHLKQNGSYSDTEMTVRVQSFGTNYTETRMVEVRDTPEWLGTAFEYAEIFTPVEKKEGGYELTLQLFDTTVVIDSGTSPYWEEDLNVTLKGEGTFGITAESIDLSGSVLGSAGIMGTQGTLSVAPYASFGYNASLLEAQLLTTAAIEKDIFEQEFGLDPLYEKLPSIITSKLPSCKIGAGASLKGELKHNMRFVNGLNPFDDLESMSLQGQPTLTIGGEATCGPAVVSLESDPTAKAAAKFVPSVSEFELLGAGAKADIDLTGELEIDIWKISGSVEETWDLYEWEVVDGEDPFLGSGPMTAAPLDHVSMPADERTGSGLVRQSAGAETAPLSGVPTVDEGVVTNGLSPTGSTDTTVRITDRAFDDAQPTIAPVGDEYGLLWSSEPASAGPTEPSDLRLRVGSGAEWGEPVTVTENDNHAGEASLATTDEGAALAAWSQFEDADRDIGNIEDQFFEEYEIAVATAADPASESSWTEPVRLTSGEAYEFDPTVKQLGPDQWVVVWDRNTAADLSDLSAEEVGYALLSTADGAVTVESTGSIADARSPDIGVTDGEVSLAFHRPGDSVTDGQVVRGTLDPATGEFDPVSSHEVSNFTDLAAAADQTVWVDGTAENPSVSTATGQTATAQEVGLSAETTRISQVELAAHGDRTVLSYQADARGSETLERDLFLQAKADGTWSDELQLARADLDQGPVTLSAANPVATAEGAVVPYGVTSSAGNSSTDVFLVERPYEPTHALSTDIETPENVSVGDEVTVTATVENVAVTTDGEPTTVQVTDGESTLTSATVGPIEPGATETVTLTPDTPATGELVVTVDGADPALDDGAFQQTVSETLVTAGLSPGETEVTRLDETTTELALTVENRAAVTSDPMTVALLDGEEPVTTTTVPAIAGEDSATVTMTFDPATLERGTSETVILDYDDDLPEGAVESRTLSVWAGQPDVAVTGDVKYRQTTEGGLVASVVLGNEGAFGTTARVSAIEQTSNEVVGVSAVELQPATGGTPEYTKVHVPLGDLSTGETVMFDASVDDTRPGANTGTTGFWDTVGPVLTEFAPNPVTGGASPQDLTGDGLYRDIDGDGSFDTDDVAVLFENLESAAAQGNAWAYGFAGGDLREQVGVADVQALFEQTGGGDVPGEPQPAGDVTVSLVPAESSVGVGEETTVDVVVEGATDGIEALDLAVSTSDVVTMTGVESTLDAPYADVSLEQDGDVLGVRAATGADALGPGTHTVATVTATVEDVGVASLTPTVEQFPEGVLAGPAQPYDVTTVGTTLSVGEGQFAVEVVEAPDTPMGESVDVVTKVTNTGSVAGAQTLTLEFASAIPGSTQTVETVVELEPGQSTEKTLSVPTDPEEDSGVYDVSVSTDDDGDQATLEVHPPAMPGLDDRPLDPDQDGRYENVDGDDQFDIFDVQAFFDRSETGAVQDYPVAFDFDGDGSVDIFDVQALFKSL